MRGAIHHHIEKTTPYRVCAETGDGAAAIEKARESDCDLIVLNLGMPGINGVQAAPALRRVLPRARIVGFTTFDDEFRKDTLDETQFDLLLGKYDGLVKLEQAIATLLAVKQGD